MLIAPIWKKTGQKQNVKTNKNIVIKMLDKLKQHLKFELL
jgi:hypothetical protein